MREWETKKEELEDEILRLEQDLEEERRVRLTVEAQV